MGFNLRHFISLAEREIARQAFNCNIRSTLLMLHICIINVIFSDEGAT